MVAMKRWSLPYCSWKKSTHTHTLSVLQSGLSVVGRFPALLSGFYIWCLTSHQKYSEMRISWHICGSDPNPTLSDACHVWLWHRVRGKLWLAQTGSPWSCCWVQHADIMYVPQHRGWYSLTRSNGSVMQPSCFSSVCWFLCYTCILL